MENFDLDYAKDNLEARPEEHYLIAYQEADPEVMAARTQIEYNKETKEFHLHMMGKGYYISHPDFEVRPENPEDDSYDSLLEFWKTKVFVLRFLTECTFVPTTGKMITYRDIPNGDLYFRQFEGRCITRLKFGFGFKVEKFCQGMEAMGATPMKQGDYSYKFEIIDGMFMQFILWEGDDEFQPNAQILFSDNFATVCSAEDLAVAGDISIGHLKGLTQ